MLPQFNFDKVLAEFFLLSLILSLILNLFISAKKVFLIVSILAVTVFVVILLSSNIGLFSLKRSEVSFFFAYYLAILFGTFGGVCLRKGVRIIFGKK